VRNRAFRIFLLATIAVWFGVVVPLHPRGVIKLGGSCAGVASGRSCCPPGKTTPQDSQPNKPFDPQCAVCHFIATMDVPPVMGLDVPAPGLVSVLPLPAPSDAPVIRFAVTRFERGPPLG
jgi:hypothetical protein